MTEQRYAKVKRANLAGKPKYYPTYFETDNVN